MDRLRQLQAVQDAVWRGSIPLEIRLAAADCRTYDTSDPYMIQCSRLSYLPFLLPRVLAFFAHDMIPEASVSTAWLSFEEVPLKWHYPIGLLFDLFSGAAPARVNAPLVERETPRLNGRASHGLAATEGQTHLPWQLVLHLTDFPDSLLVRLDDEGRVIHDAFINSVKEADFLRNGSANAIMKLSKDDSTMLWDSVQKYKQSTFTAIQSKLLPSTSNLRNIPLRIYLPATPPDASARAPTSTSSPRAPASSTPSQEESKVGAVGPTHLRVVQPLVPAVLVHTNTLQTVGTALHSALPSLFPSKKTPIQALPILHGAELPMTAPLEELVRSATYMDGWLHLGIEMLR